VFLIYYSIDPKFIFYNTNKCSVVIQRSLWNLLCSFILNVFQILIDLMLFASVFVCFCTIQQTKTLVKSIGIGIVKCHGIGNALSCIAMHDNALALSCMARHADMPDNRHAFYNTTIIYNSQWLKYKIGGGGSLSISGPLRDPADISRCIVDVNWVSDLYSTIFGPPIANPARSGLL